MEVDSIAHVPISSLFLHSGCSELAKKHLFDLRYILIRGRPFPRMGALDPLCPERVYADGARYSPYSFPGSANDINVIWEHLLETSRTLGGSSGADHDNAACLYKTTREGDTSALVHCVMMYAHILDAPTQSQSI